MHQPPRTVWIAVPLVDTSLEHPPDRIAIDDTLTFFNDGSLVIENRWFNGNWLLGLRGAEAIDYAFMGGHAYRRKHSNRLLIRTAGPNRVALVYEYRGLTPLISGVWYQMIPRIR